MRPNLAIHFTDRNIQFRHLSSRDSWIEIGSLEYGDDWNSVRADFVRQRAVRLSMGYVAAILILRSDLIQLSVFSPPDEHGNGLEEAVNSHLAERYGENAEGLLCDWYSRPDYVTVASVNAEEPHRIENILSAFGFHVLAFAGMPDESGKFADPMIFGLTDSGRRHGLAGGTVKQLLSLPTPDAQR